MKYIIDISGSHSSCCSSLENNSLGLHVKNLLKSATHASWMKLLIGVSYFDLCNSIKISYSLLNVVVSMLLLFVDKISSSLNMKLGEVHLPRGT